MSPDFFNILISSLTAAGLFLHVSDIDRDPKMTRRSGQARPDSCVSRFSE